ncbi:hypothetical protein RhiirA5_422865 [Rhizophagus irregularis]|uniref:Uncharacterized protein n=1 Tax=Rhizophagus irregularis TaxID=588596 RepID=A0A2N0PB18_9GLOM|nr:hypothetical protein RhiirA5_422865 [Rhizophagus irregularis]
MTRLSDISDVDKCKGVIIDSLKKDNFIAQANQPQQDFGDKAKKFFSEHKTALLTGGFALAGLLAGPAIVGGIVGAIGFGEAGIAAGSIAAWMMSLHRGTVAAGSLVAILQSVGAAVIEECIDGSNSLRRYLESTYGADHVSVEGSRYSLNLE